MADLVPSPPATQSPGRMEYIRFSLSQRVEHLVLLLSFTVLAVTGLPQKFSVNPVSVTLIGWMGGIERVRNIHRIAATTLLVVSIYHIIAVFYRIYVKRVNLTILPGLSDFRHLYQDLLYYFGLRKHTAYYGRYSYAEKVEYLAVVWGIAIMAITGFMMWNPIATTRFLPGEAIPAAKYAHGGEALLAVLSILLWHFYHVHIRHLNKSMFTGKLTHQEMSHEHPAELAEIESGNVTPPPTPEAMRKRQKVFIPAASILTVSMTAALVFFVTFEETAISTVPRGEIVQAFFPITPTPSPIPTITPTTPPGGLVQANTWDGGIGQLFENRCGTCHGRTAVSGLSLMTYASALEGGGSGKAIVIGEPETSILVKVQQAGNHPGQLTEEEIGQIIEWIRSGAPER